MNHATEMAKRVFALALVLLLGFSIYQIVQDTDYVKSVQASSAKSSSLASSFLNYSVAEQPSETISYFAPGGRNYEYRPMYGAYLPGQGEIISNTPATAIILKRLGYNLNDLWRSGISLVAHDDLVAKNCGGASRLSGVSGLAVKPNTIYPTCPNGQSIIPINYRTAYMCTVHFSEKSYLLNRQQAGNSTAVVAHEIGHCLYFIYGESEDFRQHYSRLRPSIASDDHAIREVMADDFMICRHNSDTKWGSRSYYAKYEVDYPSPQDCTVFNSLFDLYFPV